MVRKLNLSISVSLMLLSFFLLPFSQALSARGAGFEAPAEWSAVATGIDFQQYHVNNPRPVNIFVARLDRSNPNVTIDSSIAQGKLASGRETISNMAARYNEAINYWNSAWGQRNRVVVAINGYFFDSDTGTPWSGQVQSGWYAKRFSNTVGDAGFAWTLNRAAYIGSCVYHNGGKNVVTFLKTGYNPSIRAVNLPAGNGELILYTPQYDQDTNTVSTSGDPVLEILVEMTRPTMVLPLPAMARGYIRDIHDRAGSTPIPFDHIVLAAWGSVRTTMLEKIAAGEIAIGDEVGISQEITNCAGAPPVNWTKTYASIGGDYHFLNDGVIRTDFNNPDAGVRNSRTAIAFNDSYVYFIVVDAFDLNVSEGMTIAQLGDFAKNTLQANWGVTLDSGTSSTMVINGSVVNNTYCNFTRNCGMQVVEQGEPNPNALGLPKESTYGSEWDDASGALEPLVGNGMMMILSLPMAQSSTFSPGMEATAKNLTSIYLGPGSNYAVVGSVPGGGKVTIKPHLNMLNGVLAKGSYWWKVEYNNITGWVREDQLVGGRSPLDAYRQYFPTIVR